MTERIRDEDIKRAVRRSYGGIARNTGSCCGPSPGQDTAMNSSKDMGYSDDEIAAVPSDANMGLGCGNPTAIATLSKGEIVMDLGSGGGFDCFLAAKKVGPKGKVIGIDMTPEMIDKARDNALKGGYKNVEFRLGEIENLPAADNSVDVVISNCVINLVPNKKRVFEEAFRVLKPGGRMIVSDIVLLNRLPDEVMNSIAAHVSCLAGAIKKKDYLRTIEKVGFRDVCIEREEVVTPARADEADSTPIEGIQPVRLSRRNAEELIKSIASIDVIAVKPKKK